MVNYLLNYLLLVDNTCFIKKGECMQTIYNKNNINLNYLCNYVKYTLVSKRLYLFNTLYNKEISLCGEDNVLSELINELLNGIGNDDLLKILSKLTDKYQLLYQYLIKNFIIE